MTPIEWLEENVLGFKQLSVAQREGIMHFSLLCSAFEGKVLDTEGSSKLIVARTKQWESEGRLTGADAFMEELRYFQTRYLQAGKLTQLYVELKVGERDKELVERVLKGQDKNPGDIVAALLVIVFRLRHNLFHGTKWVFDNMSDQDENFRYASSVLMRAADLAAK